MEIKIDDKVQWTCGGVDMFAEPRKVVWISDCKEFVMVEGSTCGVPVKELTKVKTKVEIPEDLLEGDPDEFLKFIQQEI